MVAWRQPERGNKHRMVHAFLLKHVIKMKTLKFLQRFFLLLFVGFSLCAVQACGDDEEDKFDKPNTENKYDDDDDDDDGWSKCSQCGGSGECHKCDGEGDGCARCGSTGICKYCDGVGYIQ